MRPTITVPLIAALLGSPAGALGDPAQDRSACLTAKAKTEARLAACTRLLAHAPLPATDRRRAHFQRAILLIGRKKYAAALADLDAAHKLGQDDAALYRRRGLAHARLKRWQASVTDFTAAIARDPASDWTFYARAFSYNRLKQYDLALADLDRAVALQPKRARNLDSRGRLHMRLKRYAEAAADFTRLLDLKPRASGTYARRGLAWEKLGKKTRAIHDYRMATLLNPNRVGSERRLKRLVGKPGPTKGAPAAGAPVAFAAPPSGKRYRYVQLLTTTAAAKSDMEESVDELIGWFKRKKKPLPKRVSFLERRILATSGLSVEVQSRLLHFRRRSGRLTSAKVIYYRALWPTLIPRPRGARLAIDYPNAALDRLWPLAAGRTASGTGSVFAVCPKALTFHAAAIGCKADQPGQKVKIGTVTWNADVVRRERAVVPAGVIPSVVVRYRETMALKVLNRSSTKRALVYLWYAPSLRWWVRRTSREGKILSIVELMAVD